MQVSPTFNIQDLVQLFLKAALTTSYRAFACQNPPARVAPVGEAFATFWDSDNFLSLYKVQSHQRGGNIEEFRRTGEITIPPLLGATSLRSLTTRLFSIRVLLAPGLLSNMQRAAETPALVKLVSPEISAFNLAHKRLCNATYLARRPRRTKSTLGSSGT